MSDTISRSSRREFLKVSGGTVAALSLSPRLAAAQTTGTPPACSSGFDYASYTLLGLPIYTAANPGTMAAVAPEHQVNVAHYSAVSYSVGLSTTETRHLLCVDIGPNPGAGQFHPVEAGAFNVRHSITDIYVFNSADNSLLFWHKSTSGSDEPSAMFTLPASIVTSVAKVSVVARCSVHGYWGADFNLAAAPLDYTTAVPTYRGGQLFGGVSLWRPYLAPGATGGQGDATVLHRPNIIMTNDTTVTAFLGGDLDGTGKHPLFANNHYIMGGALYDQDGNLLGLPQNILYSNAGNQQVTFSGFSLQGVGATTLRVVMFDALQGLFMGFLDLP